MNTHCLNRMKCKSDSRVYMWTMHPRMKSGLKIQNVHVKCKWIATCSERAEGNAVFQRFFIGTTFLERPLQDCLNCLARHT